MGLAKRYKSGQGCKKHISKLKWNQELRCIKCVGR